MYHTSMTAYTDMGSGFCCRSSLIQMCTALLQVMTKRDMHCPNLLIHKVATLVPPPRPVKPVHPPIADIIRVRLLTLYVTPRLWQIA
jgi:hypothetical protein